MALFAMEEPVSLEAEDIRNEKARARHALLSPAGTGAVGTAGERRLTVFWSSCPSLPR